MINVKDIFEAISAHKNFMARRREVLCEIDARIRMEKDEDDAEYFELEEEYQQRFPPEEQGLLTDSEEDWESEDIEAGAEYLEKIWAGEIDA